MLLSADASSLCILDKYLNINECHTNHCVCDSTLIVICSAYLRKEAYTNYIKTDLHCTNRRTTNPIKSLELLQFPSRGLLCQILNPPV